MEFFLPQKHETEVKHVSQKERWEDPHVGIPGILQNTKAKHKSEVAMRSSEKHSKGGNFFHVTNNRYKKV